MDGLTQVVAGGGQEARFLQVAAFGGGLFLAHLFQQRQVFVPQPQGVQVRAVHAVDEGQRGHQIRQPARHQGQVDGRRLRGQRDEHGCKGRHFKRIHHRQQHVV
ncbi:hypothetical protein D3C73_865520 [compost metagenome]